MKTNKYFSALLGSVLFLASCADFDEINMNPSDVTADQAKVEYAINKSIIDAQQNPHVAERAFVLY